MEFLKVAKRHSLWSEVVYILLNIALAFAVLGTVVAIDSPLPAFALVFLSKWRVLAVRPRYWFANIQSNMIDLIVSLSLVVLLFGASGSFVTQFFLTLLYVGWLLGLKPQTKRVFEVAQAGVCVFIGSMALVSVSFAWPVSIVVLCFWLLGYCVARHVLAAYDHEAHLSFLSLIWGFILAQVGWLAYHWTIAYALIGGGFVRLPQVAIVVLGLSFLAERVYASFAKHGRVQSGDIILPTLLTLSVIFVLLAFFNDINTNLS